MSNPFTTTTATPNFDHLLLQSLMSRLQLRPPNHPNNPLNLSQSFEDLLLDAATRGADFSFSDNDEDEDEEQLAGVESNYKSSQLSKEESKLEKDIVKIILSGNTHLLKPNSGQAVTVGEHHVCVGFHEDTGSDYRVWEWHGHIMLFDDENGYTPEYIYGNYFERKLTTERAKNFNINEQVLDDHDDDDEEEEENDDDSKPKPDHLGLRELIQSGDSTDTRILHQSRNAGSPSRVLKGASGNRGLGAI